MNQANMDECAEKYGLGLTVGRCSICGLDIYEHDMITDIGGSLISHELCYTMKGDKNETVR